MYPIKLSPAVALGSKAVIKATSNIRVEPVIASSKVRTVAADQTVLNVVGYVTGDKDPANGKTDWLAWLEGGLWRYTAIDNVKSITAPVTDDGYTAATQAKAVADATLSGSLNQSIADKAAIDAANAATAQAQADLVTAAGAERERLAQALGKAEADKVRSS